MNLTFPHLIELLLIVGIIIAIGIPLFGKTPNTRPFSEIDPVEEEFKHLLVRKEEILLSIKELEVDLQADKISSEDSDALRNKLEGEAITILERIDELEKNKKKGSKSSSKNFLLAQPNIFLSKQRSKNGNYITWKQSRPYFGLSMIFDLQWYPA